MLKYVLVKKIIWLNKKGIKMNFWKKFLLLFACFFVLDLFFMLIKSLIENSMFGVYMFPLIALLVFVVGWLCVFFMVKSSKNNNKKRNLFLVNFVSFVIIISVLILDDVMLFLLEKDFRNELYFLSIGFMFLFVGFVIGRLYNMLPKNKK